MPGLCLRCGGLIARSTHHLLMAIVHGRDDLSKVPPRIPLLHSAVCDEVVEQLAALCELHDQVQLGWRVDDLWQGRTLF